MDDRAHAVTAHLRAKEGADDHRSEDPDAVGRDVLEEPGHRGEHRGPQQSPLEQLPPGTVGGGGALHGMQLHVGAVQEQPQLLLGAAQITAGSQPVAALRQQQSAPGHQGHGEDRIEIEAAPGLQFRAQEQHADAQGGGRQGPQGLKTEGPQHQATPDRRGDRFRNHEMGRGVVRPEGHPHQEQTDQQQRKTRTEGRPDQAEQQQEHLGDEDRFAPPAIRQAAQHQGTHQDSEQGSRRQQATFRRIQGEFLVDQRQGDATDEDDEAFEKLAR